MALTVTMSLISATTQAGRPTRVQVNVANSSSSSVTLNSLFISEATESDCVIGQPQFMVPGVAVGQGNPTIGANSTVSYTFDVVCQTPATPGDSPSAPTGSAGVFLGQPPDISIVLRAEASASDGSVGSGTLQLFPITVVPPFPPVATGTLQLQFSSGFNLIALMAIGA